MEAKGTSCFGLGPKKGRLHRSERSGENRKMRSHRVLAYVCVLIINSFSGVSAIEYTHETNGTTRTEPDEIFYFYCNL